MFILAFPAVLTSNPNPWTTAVAWRGRKFCMVNLWSLIKLYPGRRPREDKSSVCCSTAVRLGASTRDRGNAWATFSFSAVSDRDAERRSGHQLVRPGHQWRNSYPFSVTQPSPENVFRYIPCNLDGQSRVNLYSHNRSRAAMSSWVITLWARSWVPRDWPMPHAINFVGIK